MTRSLAFKLVLAFLLVSIAGAVLTALFARWATYQEFDRLVLDQAESNFVADATAYYQTHGSWQGVQVYFATKALMMAPQLQPGAQPRASQPPPPQPGNRERQQRPLSPYVFALADQDGTIVLPAGAYRPGDQVPTDQLARGIPIAVDDQVVGTALATGEMPQLVPQEELYLTRTNRASLYAAAAAIVVALILGILLASGLTRPLRELTQAARAVAAGDLEQQVPVRSRDELGELAAAFNEMSADLVRANDLRRQVTADVAHDLRTPLTVMAGYLEALRDGVLEPSPARFETMYQEAEHLKRLVDDLRTLSLADAGELSLNREPVPPELVLAQAADAYRHRAGQQGIDLDLRVVSPLPNIYADPDRIAQVLGNLIGNALRHTPEGGQIILSARQQGGVVYLSVRDNGEGIPPAMLPHIFDRFYRGDEARQVHEGESGLGLAIAKSIAELHGGTLSAKSAPGEGATFTLTLPGCPAAQGQEYTASASPT